MTNLGIHRCGHCGGTEGSGHLGNCEGEQSDVLAQRCDTLAAEVSALRAMAEDVMLMSDDLGLDTETPEAIISATSDKVRLAVRALLEERATLRAQLEAAKVREQEFERIQAGDAEALLKRDYEIVYLSEVLANAKAQSAGESYWKKRALKAESQLTAQPEGVRAKVMAFARLMETKLKANDHKGGWENEEEGWLLGCLKREVTELEQACDQFGHSPKHHREQVGLEAADVANFAMMLADIYGCLKLTTPAASTPPEGKVLREEACYVNAQMKALIEEALAAPAPAPRQVTHVCEACDMEWHTGKAVAEGHTCDKAPAPACKTCGGSKWVVHPVWGRPCPDCNAGEGEK